MRLFPFYAHRLQTVRRKKMRRSKVLKSERLEQRTMLSIDSGGLGGLATESINWNGSTVEAREDSWIVRSLNDSFTEIALNNDWSVSSLGEGFYSLTTPGASVSEVSAWAGSTSSVAYFEPDYVIAPTAIPNDPSFSRLWGLNNTGQSGGLADADIDAPESWANTTGSRDVVVAVIDTGVDFNHPDLAANMWVNPGEIPGDGIDNDGDGFTDDVRGWDFYSNDNDPMDDNGHGTHVAGTIGAVGNNGIGVAGVSWQVSIMPLKFLGEDGSGSTSGAIAAVNYATRMRRDFGVNVVATNNSWGGGGSSAALRDAINLGGQAGILFVAAAGNESNNNDSWPTYPASYTSDAVITVAATNRSNQLASFSNYGETSVDIAAPGVSIYSTTPSNSYASYSGTSMAAPHVAGAVALLASSDPEATATQIRSAILSSAVPVTSLDGRVATGGLLNASAALASLSDSPPEEPAPPPEEPAPPPEEPAPPPEEPAPPPEEPAPEPPAAPNEPNDSLSSATSVVLSEGEGQFSGFIGDGDNQSADVDMYSLSLGAGDTLTVDIDARSLSSRSNLDSYLRLFDGDGRQLARNDDANGSLDSFLTYGVQADGTYFIGISAYGNSSYDPTVPGTGRNASSFGHFEARVTVVSNPVEPPPEEPAPPPPIEAPVEPNDSLATAAYVNLEGESFTVSARIGDGAYRRRDVDIYQVDLAAGDTIVVDVDARSLSSPSRLDSFLRLFDSDGRQLARNDDANGSLDSFLSYDVQTEGTYFVGVSSYGNSRYLPTREGSGRRGHTTGRYEATFSRIALSDGDGDDGGILDAGDTLQTALQVDANSGPVRYSGQIGDGAQRTRDVDMYAVNLVAGQQVTVDIDARELAGGSTLDSMLKLFDADGRRLAMNDDTRSSLDSRLVFTAEVAGTYYVGVSGYGNRRYDPNLAGSGRAGSIGNYEVSFEFENASRINRIFGFRDIERGALVAAFAHYDAVADWLDSERR